MPLALHGMSFLPLLIPTSHQVNSLLILYASAKASFPPEGSLLPESYSHSFPPSDKLAMFIIIHPLVQSFV